MKCSKCGAELSEDTKFCSYCGQKIEVAPLPAVEEPEIPSIPDVENIKEQKQEEAKTDVSKSFADKVKDKGIEIWNKLSLYGKATTVSIAVFVLLCLVAMLAGKTVAVVIAIVQIIMAVVSILMHKGIIKLEQKKLWIKWLVLAVAILFTALNIMSYSWGRKAPTTGHDSSSSNQNIGETAEKIDWKNITLSKVLPEPQSNMMVLLYNGNDWLNVTVHDVSENDFLEYVRWCKDDYGFTVDSDSFDDYFYAYNKDGYCVTLFYTETSKKLNIDLSAPIGGVTSDTDDSTETQQPEQTEYLEETDPPKTENGSLSITKGTEYAYMTDEWNVYIATAISDDIIKVENWDKTMSSSKSVKHDYDVGTFKISDSENGFAWVDAEHTTFVLTFKDKNNSKFKKGGTATFTINISDSDKNKGSNFSEDIACFSYQNDDWHLYRAIPLTDTLIKIETWSRGSSLGSFLFGYDLCLIDTTSGDTDFEWTDNEHTSFSITMRDKENKYEWKKEAFVVFILENEGYTHFDVKSYLGKWEIGDGEVAVPASASDYKYDNYQDVQKDLENAGFTNIKAEILYDIVWGWTDEGEVKSVSIDGRTDYEKGEVFKKDATIIITYHMKEEDDPSNISVTENSDSFVGKDYLAVQKIFEDYGFSNVEATKVSTDDKSHSEGEVVSVTISGSSFSAGDAFKPTSKVCIKYYVIKEPEPVSYSTNDLETAKKGNTGVFSYKSRGGSYDIYWIIDFDEGYVYWFTDGNGDTSCDRIAIVSGTLNDAVTITYHDGNSTWSYRLFFKWQNQPDHLVMQDNNGFTYDYYSTNLSSALSKKNSRTIYDY